ncbi:hypothetical protein BTS2_2815 [Bacillus sp. TS-2]|nr:hypothetical protein BTS2_2815 [Bacillus sp. TS-2]
MVDLIEEVIELREKGYSFRKIAEKLGTTVGKVQYRYHKFHEQHQKQQPLIQRTQENTFINQQQKQILPHNQTLCKAYQEPPSFYDENQITLFSKTSFVLYTYWDFKQSTQHMLEHHLRQKWSNINKKLIVYDITAIHFDGHNAHQYQCISLPEMTNNWFVTGVEPNRTYIVDFAVETEQKRILTVLRSNPIDTPRLKETEKGLLKQSVHKWKTGQVQEVEWLENFSSYSYYDFVK